MSEEIKKEEELPSNVKKLSPEHALVLENLSLKLNLASEQIASLQKDIETIKSQVGGFINGVKASYFPGVDQVAVDPVRGLIMLPPEKKEEASSKSDQ